MQQDLTPKQQTSEAIRQAETILITTGQNPTADQIAGVLALTAILRKFGKKVSAVVSDPLPPQVGFLDTAPIEKSLSGLRDFILSLDLGNAEVDKLRYEIERGKLNVYITPFAGGFSQKDVSYNYGDYHFDLAIVLGVAQRNRIDRVYADNQSLFSQIPVLNLDFHRSNENYGAVNLVEPTASSLCEILVALSESLQTGMIDADIATTMLTGLIASTDRFTATHTTSKSMTVAAQLMAAGARQQQVVKGVYGDTRRRESDRQTRDSDRPARSDDRRTLSERTQQDRGNRDQSNRAVEPANRRTGEVDGRMDVRNREEAKPAVTVVAPVAFIAEPALVRAEEPARNEGKAGAPLSANLPNDPTADTNDVPQPVLDGATVTPEFEPIIAPGHMELTPETDHAVVTPQMAADMPALADFEAAAAVLRRDSDGTSQSDQRDVSGEAKASNNVEGPHTDNAEVQPGMQEKADKRAAEKE